jgi:hypothetical protein
MRTQSTKMSHLLFGQPKRRETSYRQNLALIGELSPSQAFQQHQAYPILIMSACLVIVYSNML